MVLPTFFNLNPIPPRWWSRRTCAHLLPRELQNYNFLLNNCRQENVGFHQKNIPHIQGQSRRPSKMVGGAKSRLVSNPIPTRDVQLKKTCVHQEIPQRLSQTCLWVFKCLLWRYGVSSGLPQWERLWVQQTWVGHKPSWRRSPLTPP